MSRSVPASMSILAQDFTVGLSGTLDTSPWRTSRRIYISVDVLKSIKLCVGDPVAMVKAESGSNLGDVSVSFAVGIAWPSLDLPANRVEASLSLLLTARLFEGGRARIVPLASGTKIPQPLPLMRLAREASLVQLEDLSADTTKPIKSQEAGGAKKRDWLLMLLKECLVDLQYITSLQILEITYGGSRRRFAVRAISDATVDAAESLATQLAPLSLNGPPSAITRPPLWTVTWDTEVSLHTPTSPTPPPPSDHVPIEEPTDTSGAASAYDTVGGLDAQITQIRELLELPLTQPALFARFGLKPPRGVLLHGPPGTGKTHLARAVAKAANASVIIINGPELSSAYHGETEGRLRAVFDEARQKSPCVIVVDEVDALCPRRDAGSAGEVERRVVATLLTLMDGFSGEDAEVRVVVVATTNRPHALDPALRRPGRFDTEIEVGIPDALARFSILRVLLAQTPCSASPDELADVAARAHGYVGADLGAVVREAGTRALRRWLAASGRKISVPLVPIANAISEHGEPMVTMDDLLAALPTVRASALRTLQAHGGDSPPVSFADVGGLGPVIQALRQCVEWPLKHPEAFARLGVKAPRGVLLYGPPGCSKTLLVRALASESRVNFVSIKGPELLSKYVGDSERAVRELFRKARGAAPCIVFFDEIDALATARTGATASAPTEGVLTSLLTEMDGVRELGAGVTIVGATNRPQALDGALLRPGRLDRLIFVGPPDVVGRAEVLRIRMRRMQVAPDVDIDKLAKMTDGCSGAELGALCQEAALFTMKNDMDAPHVSHEAFVEAAQRMSRQVTPELIIGYEKWRTTSGAPSVY